MKKEKTQDTSDSDIIGYKQHGLDMRKEKRCTSHIVLFCFEVLIFRFFVLWNLDVSFDD